MAHNCAVAYFYENYFICMKCEFFHIGYIFSDFLLKNLHLYIGDMPANTYWCIAFVEN